MRAFIGIVALVLALSPAIDARAQPRAEQIYVVVLMTAATTAAPAVRLPDALRGNSLFWRRLKSADAVSYQLCLGFFDTPSDAARARQQLAASFGQARVLSVNPVERENLLKAQQGARPAPVPAPPAEAIAPGLPSPAAAADTNFYLYGSIGGTSAYPGIDIAKTDAIVRSTGATNLTSEVKNGSVGEKILFGVMLNPNFAFEWGYVSLGTIKYRATYTGGHATEDAKTYGFVAGLAAMAPVSNGISIFGKIGLMNATLKQTLSVTGPGGAASTSATDTHWAPNFGGGLMMRATETLSVRVEAEQFLNLGNSNTTGQTDVTMVSVGVLMRF